MKNHSDCDTSMIFGTSDQFRLIIKSSRLAIAESALNKIQKLINNS